MEWLAHLPIVGGGGVSPDLSFTLNRAMSFLGVFKLWGLFVIVRLSCVFS